MSSTPKTILITGGSRGIGRQTALAAAERGWSVAINYRADEAMAKQTIGEVEKLGGKAIGYQADVSDEIAVIAMFKETKRVFGQLDAVVINAGIVAPSQPFAGISLERMERILKINVLGAMLCAREAARHLPRSKEAAAASIVLVSSAAARLGSPNEYVDYAASKGAIDTLTIGLAKELAPHNVRVNAVRPGVVDTDIHASGGQPGRAQRVGETVPLGRPGKAREVADAIIWLSSDEAAYTTGAILDIAGGR